MFAIPVEIALFAKPEQPVVALPKGVNLATPAAVEKSAETSMPAEISVWGRARLEEHAIQQPISVMAARQQLVRELVKTTKFATAAERIALTARAEGRLLCALAMIFGFFKTTAFVQAGRAG
jgi:predicted polyphosphate/ATP-dependent NAD kinase